MVRWWELEPEMRQRLFTSAERHGGQGVLNLRRYPTKKKQTLEQFIKRGKEMLHDYQYSNEAQERDLKIIWRCDKCGREREDYPGYNEGGMCHCGGQMLEAGESYS